MSSIASRDRIVGAVKQSIAWFFGVGKEISAITIDLQVATAGIQARLNSSCFVVND
jgi:hypothetical protein